MTIEVTPQSVILAFTLVGAVIGLIKYFSKGVRWFDKQDQQSTDIEDLKTHHNDDIKELKNILATEMRKNNEELQLLTKGVLACLKGLQEKGCNGPVTATATEIETYLNERAHSNK